MLGMLSRLFDGVKLRLDNAREVLVFLGVVVADGVMNIDGMLNGCGGAGAAGGVVGTALAISVAALSMW